MMPLLLLVLSSVMLILFATAPITAMSAPHLFIDGFTAPIAGAGADIDAAAAADEDPFSSIEVMSINYDTTISSSISSSFSGRLYCQDGCSTDDKLSMIAGMTSHTLNFEIQSVEITFFDEVTGEVLIKLNQQKFLQFTMSGNRFDDKTIPWLRPIPPNTHVGFKGAFNYNWIRKNMPSTIDTGLIIYTPANPYTYPQNIVFDQKFTESGAEFAFIDGFWSSREEKEGKLMMIIDNIKVDIVAIEVRLVGMKWISDLTRGCTINGVDAYSVVHRPQKNTMTFVTDKTIPAHSDIILQCQEPILSVKGVAPVDFTAQKETFAEIRFVQNHVHPHLPDFFYPFTLSRSVFNVIETAVPDFNPVAQVFGNALSCTFQYQLLDQGGHIVPMHPQGEFFSFVIGGITGSPGAAVVHVTNEKRDNPIVLQRVNKITHNKNVYNRSPLSLTFPKDSQTTSTDQVFINLFIPLEGATVQPGGATCRMNLIRPSRAGELVYATTTTAATRELAFKSISLPRWKQPLNGTAVAFEMALTEAQSHFDFLTISTSTFDFLWSGNHRLCGIVDSSQDDSKPKQSIRATVTPAVADSNDFNQNQLLQDPLQVYRISHFSITLNDTLARGSSATLVCPGFVYAATSGAERDSDIIKSPNTILVSALNTNAHSTHDELNAPKAYGIAMVTDIFPSKENKFNPKILIIVAVLAVLVALGGGFYYFRKVQASKRQDQEQLDLLLNEERTTLVIQ